MKKYCGILLGFMVTVLFSLPVQAELKPGDKAPGFSLGTVTGDKVMLGTALAAGKPIIISFFATWCKPCLKEIPHLQNIEKNTGVKVYLVSIDELKKEKVAEFLSANAVTLTAVLDPAAAVTGESYGVLRGGLARVPKLFLIAPSGKIYYISNGYDENIEATLEKQIAALAAETALQPQELAVFFTNSTNGNLQSCDCPANPYGGLVRRATYLKQERQNYQDKGLTIDSGDFFKPYISKSLAECILNIYELLQYDAVCPGDQELSFGGFPKMMAAYKVPFLASNVSFCEGDSCNALTVSSMIVEKAGMKILLVSALHPDVFALYPEEVTKHVTVLPLHSTLEGILEKNKGKYDLAVLVSHSGDEEDQKIAQELTAFDVIVGGHSQALLKEPVKIGKTLIVQAGPDAQNVGKLVLKFNENKSVDSFTHEIIPLTKDIPDDPQVRVLIDKYFESLKAQ